MARNSFGQIFRFTSFGESHGPALGAVIDGCPAGVVFDEEFLRASLRRRRPGHFGQVGGEVVSQRKEEDLPEVLSGVYAGKTLGTPIAIMIRNQDARSRDYDDIQKQPRVGHADDVWMQKFSHVDHRGGGRSSGRETAARVIAGAVAEMFLHQVLPEFQLIAYSSRIGRIDLATEPPTELPSSGQKLSRDEIDSFVARIPSRKHSLEAEKLLLEAKEKGLSYGGQVTLRATGVPAGLGQPVFHKLKAHLAAAMMSIGAVSAVELGDGTDAAATEGTRFHTAGAGNGYGGIRGGISTGEDILLKVSFKPTATVLDTAKKGRHDPCIVPRAVPVVEAMAALVFADHLLWSRTDRA